MQSITARCSPVRTTSAVKTCDNSRPLEPSSTANLNTPHFLAPTATRWQSCRCYRRSELPAALTVWLLDPASLTRRLQGLCTGEFRVRVLSQVRGRARLDEARVLGMRRGGLAIIRQVQLLCDEQPRVYARTVIPVSSLQGRLRRLAHLGARPLGAMLFADRGMWRGVVELARIRPGEMLHADAVRHLRQAHGEIWGRRSIFRLAHKPLLVSEIFLPGFPAGEVARLSRENR
jgi:chorismate--pyruvate lyase